MTYKTIPQTHTNECAEVKHIVSRLRLRRHTTCVNSLCCLWQSKGSELGASRVFLCVKGVGDVANRCRGDACLKACGLGQLPPHTVALCLPNSTNIPHFSPIFSSFLYPTTPPPTHTLRPLRKGEGRLMQLAPLWALLCWWIEVVWWSTKLLAAVPALLGSRIYKLRKWCHRWTLLINGQQYFNK